MTEHKCTKEEQLNRIETTVLRIDAGLRGNGKPGLFTEFAIWKNTVMGLLALNMIIIASLIALWLK